MPCGQGGGRHDRLSVPRQQVQPRRLGGPRSGSATARGQECDGAGGLDHPDVTLDLETIAAYSIPKLPVSYGEISLTTPRCRAAHQGLRYHTTTWVKSPDGA